MAGESNASNLSLKSIHDYESEEFSSQELSFSKSEESSHDQAPPQRPSIQRMELPATQQIVRPGVVSIIQLINIFSLMAPILITQ